MTQPDLFDGAAPARSAPPLLGPHANIAVGTCSWTDASLVRCGRFYPRGCTSAEARLRHYAATFPVVEVDSAYFAMPSAANAQLWVERTPPRFSFNVKAFRLLTGHQTAAAAFPRDLQPLLPAPRGGKPNLYHDDIPAAVRDELWRRTVEALAPLRHAGKLTAVLFQFAPWLACDQRAVAHVEDCAARLAGHPLAVEFRNASWFADAARTARTLAWLQDLRATHVVTDEPQGVGNFVPGVWAVTQPALAVVRLHGRNAATWNAKGLAASSERFDYEYADDELDAIAVRTLALAEQAFRVQLLVNVNFEDQGVRAAQRLQRRLARSTAAP